MGVPLRQQIAVGTYLMKQKFKGVDKYPLVLMLEPLFRCNLACSGCGKIDYPDDILNKRSQDLEKHYRLNGAIYICETEKLLEEKSFFLADNIFSYVMDRKSSVDIDEEIDFKIAGLLA